MRIGLITDYYPPYAPGGSGRSVYHMAHELAQEHDVVVITPRYGREGNERDGRLQVIRWPLPTRLGSNGQRIAARWSSNPLAYLWSFWVIWRIARREKLELLHAQDYKFSFVGAALAKWVLGVPLLFTLRDTLAICPIAVCLLHADRIPADCSSHKMWSHCSLEHLSLYFKRPSWFTRLRVRLSTLWQFLDTRLWRYRLLKRVDGIVGISKGVLAVHRDSGLLPAVPSEVVYNLPPPIPQVDAAQLEAWREELGLAGRLVVLMVGRQSPGKGVPVLYEAARIIGREMPEVLFILIGVHQEVEAPANVRTIPFSPHEVIMQYMCAADIVTVPSTWPEPLGRVGLEAMACRKPIVASRVGGIPEVVEDGVNGFLVPPRDPQALANGLLRLLRDGSLRKQMGAQGAKILAERFDPARNMERLVTFYRHCLQNA
jgi:glycosyltransferase involved in cell wall biosynthesis